MHLQPNVNKFCGKIHISRKLLQSLQIWGSRKYRWTFIVPHTNVILVWTGRMRIRAKSMRKRPTMLGINLYFCGMNYFLKMVKKLNKNTFSSKPQPKIK
jgi:hypothetical protein